MWEFLDRMCLTGVGEWGGGKAEQNNAGGLVVLMTRKAISAEDWVDFQGCLSKDETRGEETVK